MKVIDKLAWIELQNQSILSTKSYGKDKFYIPGGKRESERQMSRLYFEKLKKN
jgi:hypothetical protein